MRVITGAKVAGLAIGSCPMLEMGRLKMNPSLRVRLKREFRVLVEGRTFCEAYTLFVALLERRGEMDRGAGEGGKDERGEEGAARA